MTATRPAAGIANLSLALGVAGLVPFILLTIGLFLIADGSLRGFVAHGLAAYAAVILSFLGGVRYGAAIGAIGEAAGAWALLSAAAPAFLGWLFVVARPDVALIGLALTHAVVAIVDYLGYRSIGRLPDWYRSQRPWLGISAAATLLVAYLVLVR